MLLEALAFGPDQEAFRLLARQVSWVTLRARVRSLPAADRAAEALRSLEAAFASLPVPHHAAARRPANSPARRLEGAARLAARYAEKGLMWAFVDAFGEESPLAERDEAKTESTRTEEGRNHGPAPFRLSNFESRAGGRWRSESRMISSLTAALMVPGVIGRGRAVEIIANAVLPWLAALGPEPRARRAESIFACLPVPARYGAVRHLHEAVGSGVRIGFRRQQGMLYLLNHYCTQGGCGTCRLS